MRETLLSLFFFILSYPATGQINCENQFKKYFGYGKSLFEKGKYTDAAQNFSNAVNCLHVTATQRAEVDEWKEKCRNAINAAAHKKKTNPNPAAKPKVDIIYSDYIQSVCNEGLYGAQLQLLIMAQNIKKNKLRLCAFMAPLNGNGKVNYDSPLALDYTLKGGLSGQEQAISFDNGDECVAVTIFVPYAVMNFNDLNAFHQINTDIYVYLNGETSPISENHKVYERIATYTIVLKGSVNYYDYEADAEGGLLFDISDIKSCGNYHFDELKWSDVPSWIKIDREGFHILRNVSSSSRSASIHVQHPFGGNIVTVNIRQTAS